MILKPGFFLIKESMDVFLDSFDTCDTEVFNQDLCHIRREEGRECWSKMNVFYAQVKKRKKNDDCFLLIPGDVVNDRQIIDI